MFDKLLLNILFQIAVVLISGPAANAQDNEIWQNFSDDSLYFVARNLAFKGETDKALMAAIALIDRNPRNHDASVLVARLYAWERNYTAAREYISNVIDDAPGYYDALSALADIELWEGNFRKAVETADNGLEYHPDDTGFLVQKARAYVLMDMPDEARETIELLQEIEPGNEEASKLLANLNLPGFYHYRENSYLLSGYYGEYFREPYSRNFHMGSAGYSHYTSLGPVTAKLNFANTYIDGTGLTRYPSIQYEIESYPEISANSYLFLNYAISRGSNFPGHRAGIEYFRKLPLDYEASLGLRFLHWNRSYFFYTGSVGKYYGSMWYSVRPYLFPGDNGLSGSLYLSARKYFRTADDFAGIVLGYGLLPDETFSDPASRLYLNAISAGVEFSKGIGADYLVRGGLRYENEEFVAGTYRNRLSVNVGLRYYLTGR